MIKQEDVYPIGKIGKPHGVKGEVNFMFDDDVFDRTDSEYLILEVDGILVPFFMEEYRFRSDSTALVKFCDIDSQDDARRLTNTNVYFERRMVDETEENYTLPSLVGFKIIDAETGNNIGTVVGIDDSTTNILFEVKTMSGDEILVPVSDDLINHFDQKKQTITMTIPEGLLEI